MSLYKALKGRLRAIKWQRDRAKRELGKDHEAYISLRSRVKSVKQALLEIRGE